MNTCKNCKFFSSSDNEYEKPFGSCVSDDWETGYQLTTKDLKPNQILVEDDEGWAALVGPDFGCIHWNNKNG